VPILTNDSTHDAPIHREKHLNIAHWINNNMKCIRIGYGHIARWHEQKLSELGVETVGIIEKNINKSLLANSHGHLIFSSYEEAAKHNPIFWDICTSTESHVAVIEDILRVSPFANILVEKPICQYSQIERLRGVLKGFYGKITINENYSSSRVTEIVRDIVRQSGMSPTKIISEMSKNRTSDNINGRFLDKEHFAFGYEGTHIITNVLSISDDYYPVSNFEVAYSDMYLADIQSNTTCRLPYQGAVMKSYISKNNTKIVLHSSMEGKIGFLFPHSPYNTHHIPANDGNTRYRILAITDEAKKMTVVGYYEPVINLPRATGMVAVLEHGKLKECISPIADDTIGLLLRRAIDYFNDKGKNPYTLSQAINVVEMFQLWKNQGGANVNY
jgi:hypothetical protein